jgi:hypothetical protein
MRAVVADVSEVLSASIFRVEIYRMGEFHKKHGGGGARVVLTNFCRI